MKRVKKMAICIFLLGQAISGAAYSASVTLAGTDVDFKFDDALLGLFGPANVAGNSLYFTPVDFAAQSSNGAGFNFTRDTMNIQVTPRNGWAFSSIGLTERGDYLLLGSGTTAQVTGQIRVFDTASPLIELTDSIESTSPLNLPGVPTHNWTANAAVDLSAWKSAKTVNVTVENLLLASSSGASSLAFVEKKFLGLTPGLTAVTPVPEAETYAMMLAGLGLVGWATRRRRAVPK